MGIGQRAVKSTRISIFSFTFYRGFFNPYTTQALLGSPLAQVQQAANAHQQPNAAHAAHAAHAALGAAAHMNPAHHPLLGQIQVNIR